MVISLGRRLPDSSSGLSRKVHEPHQPFLIRPCSRWGLPGRCVSTPPVRSYRTISPLPAKAGCVISVALSVGSPRPDVIRHRALWSPDFPLRFPHLRASSNRFHRSDHPTACTVLYHLNSNLWEFAGSVDSMIEKHSTAALISIDPML